MGSISVIWNPKSWICFNQGMSSRVPEDLIYQMVIGEGEDHHHYHYQFIETISKENYDNIVNGTYKVLTFPDSEMKVLLFDENNNLIPLVKGVQINEFLLTEEHLEAINKMENDSSRVLKKDN